MSSKRNRQVWIAGASCAMLVTVLASGSVGAGVSTAPAASPARLAAGKSIPVLDLKVIASVKEVNLAWRAPASVPAISSYMVFRDGQRIATLPGSALEFADTGVTPGKRYRYAVSAVNGAGTQSAISKDTKAVVPRLPDVQDTVPPVPPEGLTATTFPGAILLDWYESNDDTDLSAYLVLRNGKKLVLLDSGTLEYRDATVKPGTSYTYSILAIDTVGNRSKPETVNATAAGTTLNVSSALPPAVYLPFVVQEETQKDAAAPAPNMALAYASQLRRYPYLTDLVGPYVTINWATTTAGTTGYATYGQVGSEPCTAHTVMATKSTISVNSVSLYQWKAMLTLTPDTRYCYRIFLGAAPGVDLLGSDPSPEFMTQLPAGALTPFSFVVLGDWGDVDNGEPYQSALMSLIAQSGARFAFTTGDNSYSSGSQTNYGDLVETGAGVSGVFGPQGWGLPGRSMAMFPALGNHGMSNADSAGNSHLLNWPQAKAAELSNGRYASELYGSINGTTARNYPSAWYAFDAGVARFYVLKAAWADSNVGNFTSPYAVDYNAHWTPSSAQYQWLQNDLAAHPSALKFVLFHYPLFSDNANEESDLYLQGQNSLEGLLRQHGVQLVFNGHAHLYQHNLVNGLTTYLVGASGVKLQRMDGGCSSTDIYALGWSNTNNRGYACGAAPIPTTKNQVYSFIKVSVNGDAVTVSPMNALGQVFDEQVYQFGAIATPTSTPTPTPTSTSTAEPTETPTSTSTSTPTSEPTSEPTSTSTSTSTPTAEPTSTSTPTNTPEPTATPTPGADATQMPSPTATNSAQSFPTETPTETPTSEPTSTSTSTPTTEPTSTSTPTNTPTAEPTSTSTSTPTPTTAPTSTSTSTSTPTAEPTSTSTSTSTPTAEPTSTSTSTPTTEPTETPTSTSTSTPAPTSTSTSTPTTEPTETPTSTSTSTPTTVPTETPTSTSTSTPTTEPTSTSTSTSTSTPTTVPTETPTSTSTSTPTSEPTETPTPTPTSTSTSTPTTVPTETPTSTSTSTPTAEPTSTPTPTSTSTPAPTSTSTSTSTPTNTPTPTPTNTPLPTATSTPSGPATLVPQGGVWHYLDNGSNQGTAWRTVGISDTWSQGAAPLGYGAPMSTTINGGPSKSRFITSYFRRTFNVTNPAQYGSLTVSVRRDDGAVVYLNGVEMMRTNMPAGSITYQTLAASTVSGAFETTYYTYTVPASALVAGVNVVAVEVHQRAANSTDVAFDLKLVALP